MAFLRLILFLLLDTVKNLIYAWIPALLKLLAALRVQLAAWCERQKLPGRLKKTAATRCIKISDPAFKRPDPMIYDQYYLMGQGIAVTWDNPDIHLEQAGVPVPPHSLKPNTVYDVVARIWNNSTEAPVVQLPVVFSYLSFGIGTILNPIGQVKVNLGVKGGPGHPAFAKIPWHTPPTPGHYCIQVFLDWFDDVNPNNNLGQTNTNVVAPHSPAEFTFRFRNNSKRQEHYRFEVDAYVIPPLTPCAQRQQPARLSKLRLAPGTVLTVPPQHDRRNSPIPAGWKIVLNPEHPVLVPGEEITVRGTATPPASFHGRQPVNVHAFDSVRMTGGITIYIDVP